MKLWTKKEALKDQEKRERVIWLSLGDPAGARVNIFFLQLGSTGQPDSTTARHDDTRLLFPVLCCVTVYAVFCCCAAVSDVTLLFYPAIAIYTLVLYSDQIGHLPL